MESEVYSIEVGDKIYRLQVKEFDQEIDVEDVLVVDINNPLGDIITFPVLFNRIGILRAQQAEVVSKSKMNLQILEANLSETYRKELSKSVTDAKGKEQIKKPTAAEVENAVTLDLKFQEEQEFHYRRVRDYDVIDSLYWSAKSKDAKLDRISEKLRPEEFSGEILEGELNNVLIKSKKTNFG